MGLSLGVKKGAEILFTVGQSEFTLRVDNMTSKHCEVTVFDDDPADPLGVYVIVATERKEILPAVFCQLGKLTDHGGQSYARLVFEAPRSVQIDRLDTV